MKIGKYILTFVALVICGQTLLAQPAERRITRSEYINMYKDDAVKEMLHSGVPASITLAQGILESGDGNSPLAKYAKNHFGIKCHKGWDGPTFHQDDDAKNECFRKYYSVYESYRDHSEFLRTRGRYDFLFELNVTDYKGWAKGLKKAGYATNPKYPQLLIRIIEENDLAQYDKVKKVKPRKAAQKPKPVVADVRPNLHPIKIHENNIKYVIAKKGDSYLKIAEAHEMALWQIYRYNDLNQNDPISEGDIIYLQPKRNKAKQKKLHVAADGESMRDISQAYGVKLKKLYEYNGLIAGSKVNKGQKVQLHKPRIQG